MTENRFIKEMLEREKNRPKPIKWQKYQEELIEDNSRYRIVVKSRQIGLSLYIAWEGKEIIKNNPHETVLYISPSQRQSRHLMDYVYRWVDEDGLKCKYHTKDHMILKNGSEIYSLPNSPPTIRGLEGHVYLDEFAFMGNDDEIWPAVLPMITHGHSLTLVSTPAGKRGQFWKKYESSRNDPASVWSCHVIPWTDCTIPALMETVQQIQNEMPEDLFQQEYCCVFFDDSVNPFPFELVRSCSEEEYSYTDSIEVPFFRGVDFAKKKDQTAIVDIIPDDMGWKVGRVTAFRGGTSTYEDQEDWIANTGKMCFNTEIDGTAVGIKIEENLRKKGIGSLVATPQSNKSNDMLMTTLKWAMQNTLKGKPNSIRFSKLDEEMFKQIYSMRKTTTTHGMVHWEGGGDGHHADMAWALAHALCAAIGGGSKMALTPILVGSTTEWEI